MAILDILHFPDPRLRQRAAEVDQVDDQLRQLVDDMFATMYQAPGIGLAATQVNVHKRVVVIDISKDQDEPRVFINPEILAGDGVEEMDVAVMGCVVNGPGESKHANIGISLPGTGEQPVAPVFIDGRKHLTLRGERIAEEFQAIVEEYVRTHYV